MSDTNALLGGGAAPEALSPLNAAVMEVLGSAREALLGHTSSRLCRDTAALHPQLRQR